MTIDKNKRRRWLFFGGIMAAGLILIYAGAPGLAAQSGCPKTLTRNLEPVVVKGGQVSGLIGAPMADLFVFKFNGNTLAGQIPVQVDQITPDGVYTAAETGLLDANDEIIFMAADLGDQPATSLQLTQTLTISPTWYELTVTDPQDPSRQGWAYLVRSSRLPHLSDDYADYDSLHQRIVTPQYKLGFADAFTGLNYLALNGGENILDRAKLRAVFSLLGLAFPLAETDLEDPHNILIKDGPVRVIMTQTVEATPGGIISTASLHTLNFGYAALVQSTAQISFSLPALVQLTRVRSSADFNSAAIGATFFNANLPAGVTVDGLPDAVLATPLSTWLQLSHPTGQLIQVYDPRPAGGIPKNFYCDALDWTEQPDCDDLPQTGDAFSYGEAGVEIEGVINSPVSLTSWIFVLPPAETPGMVGAAYADYFFNPLVISPVAETGLHALYLPVIDKDSP